MKKIEKWSGTRDAWLIEAKRLCLHSDEVRLDFLCHLYAGELNRAMWDVGGSPDFAVLLGQARLPCVDEYASFKKVYETCGPEVVGDLGYNGTVSVGKMIPLRRLQAQDPEVVAAIAAGRKFSKTNPGKISKMRMDITIRTLMPSLRRDRSARRITDIGVLKVQNRKLAAENKKLKSEVDRLKARLAAYENPSAPKRPRSPAARPNA